MRRWLYFWTLVSYGAYLYGAIACLIIVGIPQAIRRIAKIGA